jgi:hypothetical protein
MKRICASLLFLALSLLFVALLVTASFAQGPPSGIVQIFNVSTTPPTLIVNVNLDGSGNYSVSRSTLPQGTYNVQASYMGAGSDLPSVSAPIVVTVNPPSLNTSTTLTVAPNPSTFGQSVVFSGSVTQP